MSTTIVSVTMVWHLSQSNRRPSLTMLRSFLTMFFSTLPGIPSHGHVKWHRTYFRRV